MARYFSNQKLVVSDNPGCLIKHDQLSVEDCIEEAEDLVIPIGSSSKMITDIAAWGSRLERRVAVFNPRHQEVPSGTAGSFIGMRAGSRITTQDQENVVQRTFADVGRIAIDAKAICTPHIIAESADLILSGPVAPSANTLDFKEICASLQS